MIVYVLAVIAPDREEGVFRAEKKVRGVAQLGGGPELPVPLALVALAGVALPAHYPPNDAVVYFCDAELQSLRSDLNA